MVKKPQANSLIKRLCGPLGDQFCNIMFSGKNWYEDLDDIVQAGAFSVQATMPWNFPYSQSQLVFGIDMICGQKIS